MKKVKGEYKRNNYYCDYCDQSELPSHLTMHIGTDEHSNGVRPRNGGVLTPPPRHDDGHVETEHEGQRDEVRVRGTVLDY